MKTKTKPSVELVAWKSLPNEAHRAEKWSGSRTTKNKKKYNRKDKHKNSKGE